jgi:hypothetical protein
VSAVGRRLAIADDPIASAESSELVDAVTEAAKGLRFGSIEVVVHDGRVVQVVRTEKRRILR